MSARSTYVQKFKVVIDGTDIPDVVNVEGLGLGEEGTVEAPEPDRKVDISDGVTKLDPITLTINKKRNLKAFQYFLDWHAKRATDFRDVSIVILDKLRTEELHRYFYSECEIKSWKEETQEQASPKIGAIMVILLPYDVELI